MRQAQEGVVIGVGVRAMRTVRCIASARIWPLSSTTSASMAATLWYLAHGDTMVAVPNEVRLADLVEAHCR